VAKKDPNVMVGPVQFVVIGLQNEQMKGQVARELHRASKKGDIRVLDALAIQKTKDGAIRTLATSDLTPDQRRDYGSLIGALMGYGATGTGEGAQVGAMVGAATFADRTFGLSRSDIRSIGQDIPPGTTGLLVLFEHRWALRLKAALVSAGGVVVAQGMVQPEALIEFGAALAAAETAADQYEQAPDTQMH
jgi:uncharacterized membrane protein